MPAVAARVVLGLVFLAAGVAKLTDRDRTAAQFRGIGLPRPSALAVAVPVLELVIAVALAVMPVVGAGVALFVLALFTALLVARIRDGYTGPCACFGRASSRDLSWREPARNALLGLVAGVILLMG